MRVMLVVESRNLPPSYTERAKRAVMNLERRKLIGFLTGTFVGVIAFTSVTLPMHSGDEHSSKAKEAAAQSAKAAKVFDAIMQAPDKSIPRDLLARARAIAVFPQVIRLLLSLAARAGEGL
jgi:hypothetical protein